MDRAAHRRRQWRADLISSGGCPGHGEDSVATVGSLRDGIGNCASHRRTDDARAHSSPPRSGQSWEWTARQGPRMVICITARRTANRSRRARAGGRRACASRAPSSSALAAAPYLVDVRGSQPSSPWLLQIAMAMRPVMAMRPARAPARTEAAAASAQAVARPGLPHAGCAVEPPATVAQPAAPARTGRTRAELRLTRSHSNAVACVVDYRVGGVMSSPPSAIDSRIDESAWMFFMR